MSAYPIRLKMQPRRLPFRPIRHTVSPMHTITATELKTRLGEALARAATGRVAIERHGRVVAYLVPAEAERPKRPREPSSRRGLSRAQEERLLKLCASRDFRLSRWGRAGDRRTLAGVAAMLASVELFDRTKLFALAERLYPGMSSLETYGEWLRTSPIRPDRFLPMLEARLRGQSRS